MFAGGAADQQFMGRWSRRLAPLLVTFAGIADGDFVLDAGCGTASLSFAIGDMAPSARLTCIDHSAAYVDRAQASGPGDRMRFMVGDVQALAFADDTFNKALSLLVMNFVPAPARALQEMTRVTRPAGVVAAAVWDYGDAMEMLRAFWDEAVALDPASASRDERNMPLCRPGELEALWRAGGLERVEEQPIEIETPFTSFDDYWLPFLGGQGPAGGHVAGLADSARSALQGRLRTRLSGDRRDRAFTLRARAWAVRGLVPR